MLIDGMGSEMKMVIFLFLGFLASCANPQQTIPVKIVTAKPVVTAPTQSTVTLAWNPRPAAEQVTAYNLFWKYYDGHQITPWRLKTSVTSPTWTGTVSYGLYLFKVSAVSVFGESPVSNQIGYATQ